MGVVYLAEQQQPVGRRVAVKVVKVGMDTAELLSRFDSERQALARMNHPNIAGIFDAGATEEGRPYFVMEYVPGTHHYPVLRRQIPRYRWALAPVPGSLRCDCPRPPEGCDSPGYQTREHP